MDVLDMQETFKFSEGVTVGNGKWDGLRVLAT